MTCCVKYFSPYSLKMPFSNQFMHIDLQSGLISSIRISWYFESHSNLLYIKLIRQYFFLSQLYFRQCYRNGFHIKIIIRQNYKYRSRIKFREKPSNLHQVCECISSQTLNQWGEKEVEASTLCFNFYLSIN